MMWRRSLRRPGLAGLPLASQDSRDCPPFQARVVKPKISTLTPQRSSVRARMSAQVAATVIGRPRIEPELSNSSVTTVSRKSVSFSRLNDSGCSGSTLTCRSRARPRAAGLSGRRGARALLALLVSLVALAAVPLGLAAAALAHGEAIERAVHAVPKRARVGHPAPEPIEIAAGALLDQRPP